MASPYVTLLEALRTHCNLPAFPDPLPSHQLVLELEEGPAITVDFEEETSMVSLFAEIGIYEPEKELAVLSSIAEANFLWAATGGATLSAQPEMKTVYLAYETPVSALEGPSFVKCVEQFAQTCQQWKILLPTLGADKTTM